MRKIISILLCLVMVLGTAANAFADTSKGSATTLRLEKTEGKVGMTKGDGKAVTIKDGIRLYDGYDLKTDKKSAAYISLDSAKAVMMDASTDVSIKKSGNKLDIMLKSGTILLNVEDKLKGNVKGGLFENFHASVFERNGFPIRYYRNDDREIEFALETDDGVIPVEVKAENGRTQSLNRALLDESIEYGYKFTSGNVGVVGKKITLPHYMAMFLKPVSADSFT